MRRQRVTTIVPCHHEYGVRERGAVTGDAKVTRQNGTVPAGGASHATATAAVRGVRARSCVRGVTVDRGRGRAVADAGARVIARRRVVDLID